MKMSTYPVLDNRPIDQWRVTELKEELKRRKLTTKGLKEDLVRRLDEAIRTETEAADQEVDNGLADSQPTAGSEVDEKMPMVDESTSPGAESQTIASKTADNEAYLDEIRISKVDNNLVWVDVDGGVAPPAEDNGQQEVKLADSSTEGDEASFYIAPAEVKNAACENLSSDMALGGQGSENSEIEKDGWDSRDMHDCVVLRPSHEDVKLNLSYPNNQVSEVSPRLGFPVKCDSITIDSVSINETNDLKDNIIADNVKLELDVKPEMVQSSTIDVAPGAGKSHLMDVEDPHQNKFSVEETHNIVEVDVKTEMVQPSSVDVVHGTGRSHPVDVEEPHENKFSVEETNNTLTNADMSKKNYNADCGSYKMLNLDQRSVDDFMEDDASERKQIDLMYNSDEFGERSDKSQVPMVKEECPVGAMDDGLFGEKTNSDVENKNGIAASAEKRKLSDQEEVLNREFLKKQRRWKSESPKVMEPASLTLPPSTTSDEILQPTLKSNFSVSDSRVDYDGSKERVVPPSVRSPTNSLRIDNFLRPFTLKAVQELLGKTGAVTSFWMDHIKTHCYVTYSAEEEAIKTRDALYNLQWPTNGGRLLSAEFVDPEEVKLRVDAASQTPATPGPATPVSPALLLQPSPRQANIRRQQQLPPQPALPPPPLLKPPPARERVLPPPPPPLPEKLDPPIVTLDDLFRKTKATPRIYYLPLSEGQVSAKLEASKQ